VNDTAVRRILGDGAKAVWDSLPEADREWLTELTRLAPAGARVVLVGGAVRDGLLGLFHTASPDLDLAIEGADIGALATATGLSFTFHPAFGNATVTLTDGRTVDLIRTRRETYPVAGGNPVPEPGTLSDDLQRRDFGLNALALVLELGNSPNWLNTTLLDVVGGLPDVRARVLRPLHSGSFHEDASRLVRAARLAARLNLSAHADLLAQVPDALNMAECTPRLWAELRLLLAEPRPGRAARMLETWGAGQLLPPASLPLMDTLDVHQDRGATVTFQTYAAALLHAAPNPNDLAARLNLGEFRAATHGLHHDEAVDRCLDQQSVRVRFRRSGHRPDSDGPRSRRDYLSP
jgi:tRNA nucleotidyltransferase (CCA-adding enzyme)